MSPFAKVAASAEPIEVEALGSDLWYTLIYFRAREQGQLSAVRRRSCESALRASGIAERSIPALARAVLRRLGAAEGVESKLRSPKRADLEGRHPSASVRAAVHLESDRFCLDHLPRIAPGAREVLHRLRRSGLQLALISNVAYESAEGTRQLLARLGLDRFFDVIVLSPEVGAAKPDRAPFRAALRKLEIRGGQLAYLGDRPTDMVGARSVGAHPYRFTGLHRWAPPVPRRTGRPGFAPEIRSWAEVGRTFRAPPPGGPRGTGGRGRSHRRRAVPMRLEDDRYHRIPAGQF